MKKKKDIIIIVGIIAIVFIIIIVQRILSAVFSNDYTNEPFISGNTSSNLHNKGLFCEYNNIVYFANPYDQNGLYAYDASKNSTKKIANGSVKYINTDGHYIYYVKEPANTIEHSEESFAFLNGGLKGVYRCDM